MNRLKDCRLKANLTQQYVALSLGIKPPSVSNWESGKTQPTMENLTELARLYNVSTDYLLGISDCPKAEDRMGNSNDPASTMKRLNLMAERLKDLRSKQGVTQEELGNQLGLSQNAVYLYEKGEREPNFETLSQIADYFHVTTDYLLGRSDIPWPYTTGDTQGGMTFAVPNAKSPASEEAGDKTVTVSLDASPFREGLETALLHEYIRKVVAEELAKAQQEK